MTDEAEVYARVHEILDRARKLEGLELETFLERTCAGDSELRARVDELLAIGQDGDRSDAWSEQKLKQARSALEGVLADSTGAWLPAVIGGYRVLGQIGQGGMGVVYEAEQSSPRRKVAIKLLHPMHATGEGLHRFRRESELLGRLQHPGIAQIFESSTFDAGSGPQPFFAMELIDGVPLTDHAERDGLDVRARLEVIAQLCDIIEYAHGEGIVHRDLKPANILVTTESSSSNAGRAQTRTRLKVLDFGVARVTDADIAASTLQTVEGQLVGTVSYMSPEQAAGDPDKIDARSDVYSIGVLAFELLCGELPNRVRDVPLHEAIRAIREDEPRRLGTIDRSLRGDIETIVAHALEKESSRRYPSAAGLAADVRRFLEHRPIVARPPSVLYQLGKYARRNKTLVNGAGVTLAVAIVGPLLAAKLGWGLDAAQLTAIDRLGELEQTTEEQLAEVRRLSDVVLVKDLTEEASDLWPMKPSSIDRYEDWLQRARQLLARQAEHEASVKRVQEQIRLTQVIAGRIEDRPDAEPIWEEVDAEKRWRFETFTELLSNLEALEETEADVERRLEFAGTVAERTVTGPEATAAWDTAITAIAEDERYAGLELTPIQGLVPLGPDPRSGFWEFGDTQTGEPPERDAAGRLLMTGESGVVFVLLPGGTFWMGAQADDPKGPNYDPIVTPDEQPVHRVTLSPFLLSKYEMTQGQWKRIAGTNPSNYGVDSQWSTDWNAEGREPTLLHPVEWVNWFDCDRMVEKLGWQLPTEAQWEYAARGGTQTPWWTGALKQSLSGAANILDSYAATHGAENSSGIEHWLDDGWLIHLPVNELEPNPFGFHHVSGNVWEWCADLYDSKFYATCPKLDPFARPSGGERRVDRGGGFNDDALLSRSSHRDSFGPQAADHNLGLRPARRLRD